MKKILVVLLTAVLLATTAAPVYASGNGPGGGGGGSGGGGTGTQQKSPRGVFAIVGTIEAVSSDPVGGGSITVQVLRGNKLAAPFIGASVVVTVTPQTRFLYRSSETAAATIITFADLRVGQSVSVNGTTANNVWSARRITVGASLSCLP